MGFLHELSEKPWLTPSVADAVVLSDDQLQSARTTLGLKVFLGVVTMLFLLLVMAYAGRMAFEDWRPGPELGLLWFNSFVLLASSIALQLSVGAVRRGREREAWIGLLGAAALGVGFLVGQVVAWLQLKSLGSYGLTLPSVAFFYLITGLHAAHLAGGLAAFGVIIAKTWSIGSVARVRQNVELCCIYWHFLLVVWLVLFGLLFSGNNMSALLAICGIR